MCKIFGRLKIRFAEESGGEKTLIHLFDGNFLHCVKYFPRQTV